MAHDTISKFVVKLSTGSEDIIKKVKELSDSSMARLKALAADRKEKILLETQATLNSLLNSFDELCNNAIKNFSKLSKTDDAKAFGLNALNTMCTDHTKKQVMAFCENHLTWFCGECFKKHKGCNLCSSEDVIDEKTLDPKSQKQKLLSATMEVALVNIDTLKVDMHKGLNVIDNNMSRLKMSLFTDLNCISQEKCYLIKAISCTNIKYLDSTIYKDIFDQYDTMMLQLTESQNKLFEQFESVIGKISSFLKISDIIKIKKFIGGNPILKPLFLASKNAFKGAAFHAQCNGKGPTLTVVLTNKDIVFGAYTKLSWKSDGGYSDDTPKEGFIFSFSTNRKYKIFQDTGHAIYHHPSFGPTFGHDYNLLIADDCNVNATSYIKLGTVYEAGDSTMISGGTNFTVKEYEVFSVTQII